MYVRDLELNEYSIQITYTNEKEVNGNQSLSATILPTKVNKAFIQDIAEMWNIVDHDDVEHKVIYAKRKGEGQSMTVEIKAIPLFFDVLNNDRIYDNHNEHMTASKCFDYIFNGLSFGYVLNDSFDSVQWEGFGNGESKLESFKRALERYNAEFEIAGNTVHLKKQIGVDTQFQYRHKLNASNIEQEIDADEMWTFARGYGDYDDDDGKEGTESWENAKLIREYESPLINIIGKRHAPPIKDGRVKVKANMDKALKELVDESLKISVTADVQDLRKQGYPLAQPNIGDRAFLIDERIGLDEEVRIISMSITRDWQGRVIDLNVTFGNEGLSKRHQSSISTAIKDINDIINGNKQLPYSILDDAVKNATKALKDARTQLDFNINGIVATDKNNPNLVTIFNSSGIGVSEDGGATYKNSITGRGVVAETIIGSNIIGLNLTSTNEQGRFSVSGSDAEFYNRSSGRSVKISPDGIYGYNASQNIRFQADYQQVFSSALGTSNTNVYLAAQPDGNSAAEARVVDYRDIPGDGSVSSYRYVPIRSLGFHGNYLAVNQTGTSGKHLYLYPAEDSEVRVTSQSDTSKYRNIRASGYYGTFLDARADATSTAVYLRPNAGGEARITQRGTVDNYLPIRAASFEEASHSDLKENIKPLTETACNVIDNLEVIEYNYIHDVYKERHVGFRAEESKPISNNDQEAISISKVVGYNTKAIQEILERLDKIEEVVK